MRKINYLKITNEQGAKLYRVSGVTMLISWLLLIPSRNLTDSHPLIGMRVFAAIVVVTLVLSLVTILLRGYYFACDYENARQAKVDCWNKRVEAIFAAVVAEEEAKVAEAELETWFSDYPAGTIAIEED